VRAALALALLLAACSSTAPPDAGGDVAQQVPEAGVDAAGDATPCVGPWNVVCGGVCRDLLHDPANCGGCGQACAAPRMCLRGGCIDCAATGAGYVVCGDFCANANNDAMNCGACGHACDGGPGACNGGACR